MFFSGCSAKVEDYSDTRPVLKFDEFFNGPIKAWGIVQDRNGKVQKRFEIDMVGKWQGDAGTLDEDFRYDDGKTQQRQWRIEKVAGNKFIGRADDIKGEAKGESRGMAIKWNYVMKLEVGGSTYNVHFDDWMFLVNDKILVNRSYLSKFGIRAGELSIFMQKP